MPPEITVPSELLPASTAGVRLHVRVGLQVRLQVTPLVELLPTGGAPVLESLKYLIQNKAEIWSNSNRVFCTVTCR